MDKIPQALLLAISMAACLGCTIIRKYYSDKFSGGALPRYVYNAITAIVSAISLFVLAVADNGLASVTCASPFTVLLAIAFGIITAVQQIMVLKSFETGPFAYTSVITSLSMLIPTLSGALLFGESIAVIQYFGIALMVVCLVLSVNRDSSSRKASFKWLVFCGIAFLCTGLIGVMQKWHQNTEHAHELNAFLIIAFIIAFVYSVIMSIFSAKKEQKKSDGAKISTPFLRALPLCLMTVAGVCIALNNMFNLYLSGVMTSAVFFPLVNGGGLILTTLSALIIFREKLTVRQWIGVGSGIAAVILLCNPF